MGWSFGMPSPRSGERTGRPHVFDWVGQGRTSSLSGHILQHLKKTNLRLRPNNGKHWYLNLRDRCQQDRWYDTSQRCLGYTSELLPDPNVWTYDHIRSEAYNQQTMWEHAKANRAHRRQLLLWLDRRDYGTRPGADVMPVGGQAEHDRMHQERYGASTNVRDPSGSRRHPVTAHPPVLRTGAQAALRQRLELTPARPTQAASSSSSQYVAASVPDREGWSAWPPARGSPGTPWAHDPSSARWSDGYDSRARWGHNVAAGQGSSPRPEISPPNYESGWDRGDRGGGWGRGDGGGNRGAGGWTWEP